jgi:hypothetical protein
MAGCIMKPIEKAMCRAQPKPLRYFGPAISITAIARALFTVLHHYRRITQAIFYKLLLVRNIASGADPRGFPETSQSFKEKTIS